MRTLSLCLLAILFVSLAQAYPIKLRRGRRIQQFVKPVVHKVTKPDTGKSDVTKKSENTEKSDDKNNGPTIHAPEKVNPAPKVNANGTIGYKVTVGGHAWDLSWQKWIWGVVFLVFGVPLCLLGLPWWKLLRLPIGALVGFWTCNYLEVYAIMPYVTMTTALEYIWFASYFVAVVLGFVLFWFCKKLSVAVTLGWMMSMLGVNLVWWIESSLETDLNNWIDLSIILGMAAVGIILACTIPDKSIIFGSAITGATLCCFGLGILLGQYPNVTAGQAQWVWWMYLAGQVILSIIGVILQFAIKKKKGCTTHEYPVHHETMRDVGLDYHVEVKVEGSNAKMNRGGDSDFEDDERD